MTILSTPLKTLMSLRHFSRHLRPVQCLVALVFCLPWGVQAAEFWNGWVSWVMDGDTVLLVREGQHEPVKLRIQGIDAPETCQPGGTEARDAMIRLALRKSVQVEDQGQDSYGRQIGRLSVDGVDLGAEMVRSGMAWAYKFRTGKGPYAGLQRQAQQQKKGLFGDPETAMSPPVFRKFHGTCHGI
jgi:endonuclease YncB( thermonuclease family)